MGKKARKIPRHSRRQKKSYPAIVGMGAPRHQKVQKKRKKTPADGNGKHLANPSRLKKQLAGKFVGLFV